MSVKTASALAIALSLSRPGSPSDLPFSTGERVTFRITYLYILAGHASLGVEAPPGLDRHLRFVEEAKSQGFFSWLFRYKVDDRTVADWDPALGSLGIEKHLREGRAVRDQRVLFDPAARTAVVQDRKIAGTHFDTPEGVLDVLSALYVTRVRGVPEGGRLALPVFDNGKAYELEVASMGHEVLDLPAPLGRTDTVIVEPRLVEGTGVFAAKGRLFVWLTKDERRIPVRLRSKVALGSVSADLESYERGGEGATVPAAP